MTEIANRWRTIAGTLTERTLGASPAAWANSSPCEGWTARDVVSHLVEWVPPFLLSGAGITISNGPSIDTDPAGAWAHLSNTIQALLDDPEIDTKTFDHPYVGHHRLDVAIERFVLGDVLIHTWDVSRATGQDEQLDPTMVASMLEGVAAMGDALQESGQYGARIHVPDEADNQTKLLARTGRTI